MPDGRTRQTSNTPLLLLVDSQEKIRVTDGVGGPGGCSYTQVVREGAPAGPQTAVSSRSPPTKRRVLLSQLSYGEELPLMSR